MRFAFLFFLTFYTLSLTTFVSASDVFVVADKKRGQGIFRSHDNLCYVITAGHVIDDIDDTSELYVTTHSKAKLGYSKAVGFKDDIAILQLKENYPICVRKTDWSDGSNLEMMLKHYSKGVIRLFSESGNYSRIPVSILAVNSVTTIHIQPQNSSHSIKQGYSGSPVYIGDTPIGILTSVDGDNGIGTVIRQDHLTNVISSFFKDHNITQKEEEESDGQLANEENAFGLAVLEKKEQEEKRKAKLEGEISKDDVPVFVSFKAQKNCPLVITLNNENCLYDATITDRNKNILFTKTARQQGNFIFTPPKSGKYEFKLVGRSGRGKYVIEIQQYTTDAELNSESNILGINDIVSGNIAKGAVGQYTFSAQENSPLVFSFNRDKDLIYLADIMDVGGNVLFHKDYKTFGQVTFTPPETGQFILKLTGHKGLGEYNIGLQQYITDAELNSESNLIGVNDSVTGKIAAGAVGTYKFSAEKNSPLLFTIGGDLRYAIEIQDNTGSIIFSKSVRTGGGHSNYEFTPHGSYVFTPNRTGNYTIVIRGSAGFGNYSFGFKQITTDSELNSEDNVLHLDSKVTGKIASGATGKYTFNAESGLPLTLVVNGDTRFMVEIKDATGQTVLNEHIKTGGFPSYIYTRNGSYNFTPPESGEYTLHFKGSKGSGKYIFGLARQQ